MTTIPSRLTELEFGAVMVKIREPSIGVDASKFL